MDKFQVGRSFTMADWSALKEQADDLISMYTSQSRMKDNQGSQSWVPPTPGVSNDATFCTQDNLQNCLTYLDQELQVIGFSTFLPDSGVSVTTVSLVNRLYEVLRLYQRSSRIKEEIENRLHRSNSEKDHYIATNNRLKRELELLERNLSKQEEKYRQLSVKHKTVSAKHKTEKEEVKRLQSVLQQKEVQARHEVRKHEKEAIKLKERLHQLLVEKDPKRKVGMDLMNVVQRSGQRAGQRGTWQKSGHKKEEELYQIVIGNYEEKQKELMVENGDLRNCVMNMQRQLTSVLDRTTRSQPSPPSQETSRESLSSTSSEEEADDVCSVVSSRMTMDDLELSEGHYQMPYDIIRGDIERRFKTVCKKIRKKIKKTAAIQTVAVNTSLSPQGVNSTEMSLRMGDSRLGDTSVRTADSGLRSVDTSMLPGDSSVRTADELERVHDQLLKYKQIIKQQEELIQQSLHSQTKSVESSFYQETQLLDEKESLSEQKKLFYQEKAHFEEERRKFTEAAIKLGKERKAIQSERCNLLLQQFMNITPFRDAPKSAQKREGSRLLPATPIFSPAPGKSMKTPTTVEFYRTLGITPQRSNGVRKAASTESVRTSASKKSVSSTHSSPASLQLLSTDSIDTLRMKLFHKGNSTANNLEEDI